MSTKRQINRTSALKHSPKFRKFSPFGIQFFQGFTRVHHLALFQVQSAEIVVPQARIASSKVVGGDAMKAVVYSVAFVHVYLGRISLTKSFRNSLTYVEAKVTISLRCVYWPHLTELQELTIPSCSSHYQSNVSNLYKCHGQFMKRILSWTVEN